MKFIDVLVKRSRLNGLSYRYQVLPTNLGLMPVRFPCRYHEERFPLTRSVVTSTAKRYDSMGRLNIGSGEDCFA